MFKLIKIGVLIWAVLVISSTAMINRAHTDTNYQCIRGSLNEGGLENVLFDLRSGSYAQDRRLLTQRSFTRTTSTDDGYDLAYSTNRQYRIFAKREITGPEVLSVQQVSRLTQQLVTLYMQESGQAPILLERHVAGYRPPVFSKDGAYLYYAAIQQIDDLTKQAVIGAVRLDGRNQLERRLVPDAEIDSVTESEVVAANDLAIYAVSLPTLEMIRFPTVGAAKRWEWSPQHDQLAVIGLQQDGLLRQYWLSVYWVHGELVATSLFSDSDLVPELTELRWSPDGQKLLLTESDYSTPETTYLVYEIGGTAPNNPVHLTEVAKTRLWSGIAPTNKRIMWTGDSHSILLLRQEGVRSDVFFIAMSLVRFVPQTGSIDVVVDDMENLWWPDPQRNQLDLPVLFLQRKMGVRALGMFDPSVGKPKILLPDLFKILQVTPVTGTTANRAGKWVVIWRDIKDQIVVDKLELIDTRRASNQTYAEIEVDSQVVWNSSQKTLIYVTHRGGIKSVELFVVEVEQVGRLDQRQETYRLGQAGEGFYIISKSASTNSTVTFYSEHGFRLAEFRMAGNIGNAVPIFSPGGQQAAIFSQWDDLTMLELATTYTDKSRLVSASFVRGQGMQWSPDGRYMLVYSAGSTAIDVYDAEGYMVQQWTRGASAPYTLEWTHCD